MAKQRLEEIRKVRLERVRKLRELGIDPYPGKVDGKPEPILTALESLNKTVEVAGRIIGWRGHGNVTFADLKDESGKIQLWFQKKNLGKDTRILRYLDMGDFIYVKGKVTKTKAGELTVDVSEFQLLTKSIRPLPSSWSGFKDVEERYRQRYVDLAVNDDVREIFRKKARIIQSLRKLLDENGYIEVKTPTLQLLYGGATAKPFITHHNVLDIDLYLRISDELYLKRLMVGGFEKVYELCTDFRNEGIDRWHNPEFSMLEFYWAYADYNQLMRFTEELISKVVKKICGSLKVKYGDMTIDFNLPWKRVPILEAFESATGIAIDKSSNFEDVMKKVRAKGVKLEYSKIKDLPTLLDEAYKVTVRPGIINPTFMIDHPYKMRPLSKRKSEDKELAASFHLIVGNVELVNGYTELNDPADQRLRWEEDMERGKKGADEYQVVDEDYLRALEYGMPPTAGWGMGIDRFTAILTNQHSIKDTVLFPTLRPEKDE